MSEKENKTWKFFNERLVVFVISAVFISIAFPWIVNKLDDRNAKENKIALLRNEINLRVKFAKICINKCHDEMNNGSNNPKIKEYYNHAISNLIFRKPTFFEIDSLRYNTDLSQKNLYSLIHELQINGYNEKLAKQNMGFINNAMEYYKKHKAPDSGTFFSIYGIINDSILLF